MIGVIGVLLAWLLGNHLGWLVFGPGPYNWRVCLGPWPYYKWFKDNQ